MESNGLLNGKNRHLADDINSETSTQFDTDLDRKDVKEVHQVVFVGVTGVITKCFVLLYFMKK